MEREDSQGEGLLAEAFAVAAVVMSGAALLGTRVAQTLGVVTAGSQLNVYARIVVGDGVTALVAAALAAVALLASGPDTRAWARRLSVAALVVSGIVVVTAAVTFGLLPSAPQPQVG